MLSQATKQSYGSHKNEAEEFYSNVIKLEPSMTSQWGVEHVHHTVGQELEVVRKSS